MSEVDLERWSGHEVVSNLDHLANLYVEVYAEPPYNSGALWSADEFKGRTERQVARDGFSFVAALSGEEIVGFSFGLSFAAGAWWSGDASKPPEALLAATKFAVIELLVRRDFRKQGVGRHLLNQLLDARREAYAILTAMPEAPAREMYRRWGWEQVGTAHHSPDSPVLDALALRISNGGSHP